MVRGSRVAQNGTVRGMQRSLDGVRTPGDGARGGLQSRAGSLLLALPDSLRRESPLPVLQAPFKSKSVAGTESRRSAFRIAMAGRATD
jgi:hypothetical protein